MTLGRNMTCSRHILRQRNIFFTVDNKARSFMAVKQILICAIFICFPGTILPKWMVIWYFILKVLLLPYLGRD